MKRKIRLSAIRLLVALLAALTIVLLLSAPGNILLFVITKLVGFGLFAVLASICREHENKLFGNFFEE